jgi:hypothetical protein
MRPPLSILASLALMFSLASPATMGQEVVPEQSVLRIQYAATIRPLMQIYCIRCHGQEAESGGIRLDNLADVISDQNFALWTDAKNVLDVGAMPPAKQSHRPSLSEQNQLLGWIDGSLKRYEADRQNARGDTLLRRVNNRAYANMIRTLLGVPAQMLDSFPPAVSANGYDTVGSGLVTTTYLYDLYMSSIQRTMDLAFPDDPSPPMIHELQYKFLDLERPRMEVFLERWINEEKALAADAKRHAKIKDVAEFVRDGTIEKAFVKEAVAKYYHRDSFNEVLQDRLDWANDAQCIAVVAQALHEKVQDVMQRSVSAPEFQPLWSLDNLDHDATGRIFEIDLYDPGYYDISARVCLSDANKPLPVGITLDGKFLDQCMVFEPESAPLDYHVRIYLDKGLHRISIRPPQDLIGYINYVNATYGSRYVRGTYLDAAIRYRGMNLPTSILSSGVQVRGPLVASWPPPEMARTFTRGLRAAPSREYAEEILAAFMRRAYVCDCDARMAAPFVDLAMSYFHAQKDFVGAIKYALSAALCSPRFLNLCEIQRQDASKRRPLGSYELARRLAYFLWSDLPDDALMESAASGALLDPKELQSQTRRMIADPRSSAFREAFTTQWLTIDKLEAVPVSNLLFPRFDTVLLKSAKRESVAFFSEILDHDLNVSAFIVSDFAMLDGRMAQHYGIPGVTSREFHRVALPRGLHRGGVLTQASVLIATSNGMVSSPVRRGALIMERLLGVSPGTPPPNVPALGKTPSVGVDGMPLTPRERLAQHRSVVSCARCHDKIDPLGDGLENYDALGSWSSTIAVLLPDASNDGKPVWMSRPADVGGTMLDGTAYNGPEELKQRLLDHQAQFARALAEHLSIYALGRGLDESDRPLLDQLCARVAASGNGLATLVEDLVKSELFTSK